MNWLRTAVVFALGLMLSACGGGSSASSAINGNWTASLTNTDGTTAFTFSTTLALSGSTVNVSNFSFTTAAPCFGTAGSETGTFTLSGTTNGVNTGSYQMTIQSGVPSGNTLTLQGTLSGSTITGVWTLSGPGCTGSGNFTMSTS
jgi:hypothetical protein